jgi:hypothetical protein
VNRLRRTLCGALLVLGLAPAVAFAQNAPQTAPHTTEPASASSFWLSAGGLFATARGDCQTCEGDFPYRHSGGLIADVGRRVNSRMDVGGELFWMQVGTASGKVRATHIDAVAQFRPWGSQGFFLKGGAGMAFVRNWVDVAGDPINSKALSIVIGAGWAFRWTERFGFEVFVAQHAAALGDFRTAETTVNDVLINFWTVGAAIVIR